MHLFKLLAQPAITKTHNDKAENDNKYNNDKGVLTKTELIP